MLNPKRRGHDQSDKAQRQEREDVILGRPEGSGRCSLFQASTPLLEQRDSLPVRHERPPLSLQFLQTAKLGGWWSKHGAQTAKAWPFKSTMTVRLLQGRGSPLREDRGSFRAIACRSPHRGGSQGVCCMDRYSGIRRS